MAFRSVRMRLFNMTSNSLTKTFEHLDHGIFTDPFSPPSTVVPDQLAEWRGESSGILTGTQGRVEYTVDGSGDIISLAWDNPAAGNTFFGFTINNNGPSDFVWFSLHFAFDGAAAPPPGQLNPLFAVSQGDQDGAGLIFPFPGQEELKPHAWFDIGLRNKQEPVSVQRWFKAIGGDPSQGLAAAFSGRSVDVKQLIELPINR